MPCGPSTSATPPGWCCASSRRCADPGAVDQAVQDTFLAGWRKPGSYKGDGAVAAWIWGIGGLGALRRNGP